MVLLICDANGNAKIEAIINLRKAYLQSSSLQYRSYTIWNKIKVSSHWRNKWQLCTFILKVELVIKRKKSFFNLDNTTKVLYEF